MFCTPGPSDEKFNDMSIYPKHKDLFDNYSEKKFLGIAISYTIQSVVVQILMRYSEQDKMS